ncbi:hypothetical protein A7G45_01805 [Mycolicibacterium llatzerense]|uniref:HTH tetR-type domain-containing protein n=1 Tax=Mycolicibacterium llatzerense TaxID=280871 RepID=A0A0D1LDD4_9MYCO|nr:hypothetical protein TL10_00465 [Mycolicibacterium llatzerense]MCT7361535.1 hypothetical protein [Mycolicibacterium llatzerense]
MRRIVSVDDYFDAAIELLVTEGPGSIKVGSLCSSLGVTTGSFYGYFRGLEDFVEALLAARLSTQNRRLAELTASRVSSAMRMAHLREVARDVPHHAEAALRTWAAGNRAVARLQQRLDEERVATLVEFLRPIVVSPEVAARLGDFGMVFLIGWQHRHAGACGPEFDVMFDHFEAVIRQYAWAG